MGDRDRQCIRRVGWGGVTQSEDYPNHLRHLPLVRAPSARHRAFDAGRRVLRDAESRAGAYQKRDPSRMTQLGGGLRVFCEEEPFYAGFCWRVCRDDPDELPLDRDQSIREGGRRIRVDHAVRDMGESRPVTLNDSPAEVTGARVESQHDDQSLCARHSFAMRAISSSEMSKSAYTFCTSSWSSRVSARLRATSASRPASAFLLFGR